MQTLDTRAVYTDDNLSELLKILRFKVEFRSAGVSLSPVIEHVTFHQISLQRNLTTQRRIYMHVDFVIDTGIPAISQYILSRTIDFTVGMSACSTAVAVKRGFHPT